MWAEGCLNQSKTLSLGGLSVTWLPAINFFCCFFIGTQRIVGSFFFYIFNFPCWCGDTKKTANSTSAALLCLLFAFLLFCFSAFSKSQGESVHHSVFLLLSIVSWRLCCGTWTRQESEQTLLSDWLTASPKGRQGAKTWQEVALLGGGTYSRQGGERRSRGGEEEQERREEKQWKVGGPLPPFPPFLLLLFLLLFLPFLLLFLFLFSSSSSLSSSVSALLIFFRYFNADKVLRKSNVALFPLYPISEITADS